MDCLIEMTAGYVLRCGRGRGNMHFNAGERYRVTVEDAVNCIEAKVAKPVDDNGELAELYAFVHAPEPADDALPGFPVSAAELERTVADAVARIAQEEDKQDHEGAPVDEGPDA